MMGWALKLLETKEGAVLLGGIVTALVTITTSVITIFTQWLITKNNNKHQVTIFEKTREKELDKDIRDRRGAKLEEVSLLLSRVRDTTDLIFIHKFSFYPGRGSADKAVVESFDEYSGYMNNIVSICRIYFPELKKSIFEVDLCHGELWGHILGRTIYSTHNELRSDVEETGEAGDRLRRAIDKVYEELRKCL